MILKKAQIGATITWAVAFFIILVLMIGFLVIATALSGKEFYKKNEITLVENNIRKLENQRDLMVLLNVPLDDGKIIKELVEDWRVSHDKEIKEKIKLGVEDFLEEEKCYLFRVDYELDDLSKKFIWISKGDFNKDYIEFIGENAMRISEEISEIIIFSDDQKINTELYIEEC